MRSNADGQDFLFSDIGDFLCACREAAEARVCTGYWQTHPCITAAEIDMLASLCGTPAGVEAIASRLDREVCATRELLSALMRVGLLERCGEMYRATTATMLYCRMVADSRFP